MRLALLLLVASYLLGSIPFPLIVSWLVKGIDLRQHGTGNMGATNAARVLGKQWFPVVFGLDAAKGALAAYMGTTWLAVLGGVNPTAGAVLSGAAAVIGHCFPIYVGFRGGVGLAASAGTLIFISPPWTLLIVVASILLFWKASGDMYVGVAVTALLFPVLAYFRGLHDAPGMGAAVVWAAVVCGVHWRDVNRWLTKRLVQ